MEKGSVVQLDFSAKELVGGRVFDTTQRAIAEKEGVPIEGKSFQPLIVVVGDEELFPALEKALLEMKEGEQKTVELQPSQAFGERNPEWVVVVPLQEFKKRALQPFPGMVVELNDRVGKVQSVSGGRVRVDFNHELAGKRVQYELRVLKEFKGREEKANALASKYFPLAEEKELRLEWNGKTLSITVPARNPEGRAVLNPWCAKALLKSIPEIEQVEFKESYERKAFESKPAHRNE